MSKWNETGILRKKQVKDNYDDLLVFGYACKLFRDDEKALYIDQGKHLIPWMGDEKLKIDRYDGRGALADLTTCEASKEGYDAMRWLGLSESERKIEQLCDEERYYSLHSNEEDEAMYKEEEMKRKQANEFQYSYDVPRDPEQENSHDSIPTCEEEVKPFVPPTELDVPVDISIPKTYKENARIEKTALFVSKQGPQMEILIKAKQGDNPQFNFMNQKDPLYKYYRHVLSAIKNGRYKPQSEGSKEEYNEKESVADEEYLHPSLAQTAAPPPVSSLRLPQIQYKPNADCAYTQLVTRIQGNNTALENAPLPPQEPKQIPFSQMNTEQQQQYYQYYYSMQYYEYYKQIAAQYAAQAGCDPQTILQNSQLQEQIQNQASHYAQAAYNQYIQQSSANSYAQIVTNLAPSMKDLADATATTSLSHVETPSAQPEPKPPEVKIVTSGLAALVHYSSDSEEEEQIEPEQEKPFKVPPDDIAIIIDKMANYVSKNGEDFENIVRSKGDPRFEFLKETHEYFKYYRQKLEEYKKQNIPEKVVVEKKEKPKEKRVIAPVSFSIKKQKEEAQKEIKSALPIEESDEELEEEQQPKEATTPPLPTINSSSVPISSEPISLPITSISTTQTDVQTEACIKEEEAEISIISESVEKKTLNGNESFIDDPILEMIDLTGEIEDKKEIRRAEDRIKDKLAQAAKDRLSSRSKDRTLQMERRKRAAMFLKMKGEGGESDSRSINKSEENHKEAEEKFILKKQEILKIDDSESEEGEIKREKKSSKKKKSHKRKRSRSRSRHESKSHRKKSKKRRRRSKTRSRSTSASVT